MTFRRKSGFCEAPMESGFPFQTVMKSQRIPQIPECKMPVSAVSDEIWNLIDAGTHVFSRKQGYVDLEFDSLGKPVIKECLGPDGREIITSFRLRKVAAAKRPKCGATRRDGKLCCQPVALKADETFASRCRFHGGKSTGPRTCEGRAKIAESNRRRRRPNFESAEPQSTPNARILFKSAIKSFSKSVQVYDGSRRLYRNKMKRYVMGLSSDTNTQLKLSILSTILGASASTKIGSGHLQGAAANLQLIGCTLLTTKNYCSVNELAQWSTAIEKAIATESTSRIETVGLDDESIFHALAVPQIENALATLAATNREFQELLGQFFKMCRDLRDVIIHVQKMESDANICITSD